MLPWNCFKEKETLKAIFQKTVVVFDAVLLRFVRLICILLILTSLYALYDSFKLFYNAQNKKVLKYKPKLNVSEKLEEAIDIPGSVAWLAIDDTTVDYPIMQGATNTEYLNKDPFGNFSFSGSIFMDFRNSPDFSDPYSLVYGHHMEHKAMFGALDDFKDEAFFEDHQDGVLAVSGGETHPIRIFAVMKCMARDEEVFSTKWDFDRVAYYREHSTFFEEQESYDNILALTTCAAGDSEERLAVFAVILE